tara:strand:- start:617 stop:871 length:255 start_codon:yes stop_codon:yes gene_type:complete
VVVVMEWACSVEAAMAEGGSEEEEREAVDWEVAGEAATAEGGSVVEERGASTVEVTEGAAKLEAQMAVALVQEAGERVATTGDL